MQERRVRKFSPEAIAHLRSAVWDPEAQRLTDLLAGAFFWSDEKTHEVLHTGIRQDYTAERMLIAYRASLAMGNPRATLSGPWEQVCREVPDWPGLRPERRSKAIGEALEADLLSEYEAFIRLMADRDEKAQQ